MLRAEPWWATVASCTTPMVASARRSGAIAPDRLPPEVSGAAAANHGAQRVHLNFDSYSGK